METTTNEWEPPKRPKPGDTMMAFGKKCTIRKVYKFGTCDIETPEGKWFRVTGLGWL